MVAAMPEPIDAPRDDAKGEKDEKVKEVSLKVDKPEADLVSKLARMRGVYTWQLFKQKDVREFFSLLLIEEMDRETARLAAEGIQPRPKKKKNAP